MVMVPKSVARLIDSLPLINNQNWELSVSSTHNLGRISSRPKYLALLRQSTHLIIQYYIIRLLQDFTYSLALDAYLS